MLHMQPQAAVVYCQAVLKNSMEVRNVGERNACCAAGSTACRRNAQHVTLTSVRLPKRNASSASFMHPFRPATLKNALERTALWGIHGRLQQSIGNCTKSCLSCSSNDDSNYHLNNLEKVRLKVQTKDWKLNKRNKKYPHLSLTSSCCSANPQNEACFDSQKNDIRYRECKRDSTARTREALHPCSWHEANTHCACASSAKQALPHKKKEGPHLCGR